MPKLPPPKYNLKDMKHQKEFQYDVQCLLSQSLDLSTDKVKQEIKALMRKYNTPASVRRMMFRFWSAKPTYDSTNIGVVKALMLADNPSTRVSNHCVKAALYYNKLEEYQEKLAAHKKSSLEEGTAASPLPNRHIELDKAMLQDACFKHMEKEKKANYKGIYTFLCSILFDKPVCSVNFNDYLQLAGAYDYVLQWAYKMGMKVDELAAMEKEGNQGAAEAQKVVIEYFKKDEKVPKEFQDAFDAYLNGDILWQRKLDKYEKIFATTSASVANAVDAEAAHAALDSDDEA